MLELLLCVRHVCKLRCLVLFLRRKTNLPWQLTLEPFSLYHNTYRIVLVPSYVRSSLLYFRPVFFNCLLNGSIIWKKYIFDMKFCSEFDCDNYYLKLSQIKSNSARCYHLLLFFLRIARYFLSDFNQTWIFSAGFSKSPKCISSTKSVPWYPTNNREAVRNTTWQN